MSSNFDRVYILGDSLSDTGNVLSFTGGQFPTSPYQPGRFSNGDVWVDYLGEDLNLNIDPFTAPTIPNDGINFAIGGANSGNDNVGVVPLGLEQQVDSLQLFLSIQSPEETTDDDLFFLFIGSNDYFSFIQNDPTTPDVVETNFPQTFRDRRDAVIEVVDINIGNAIQDIIDAGGEHIVLFNLPDLDDTPLAQNLTRQDQRQLRRLTNIHNRRLSRLARRTERTNPNVEIVEVDINELFDDILDDPNEFGFTNVTDNFTGIDLYAELNQPPAMGNPNDYLFWDSVHVTTKAQELVADLVMEELADEGFI